MAERCIIIGASHAGAHLAACLRMSGWKGDIQLIGSESYLPYHRPPLSKTALNVAVSDPQWLRPAAFYEKNNIEVLLNTEVTHIDRANREVQLANGDSLAYDKLAFCTGARVRKLRIPGADLNGIYYLRDWQDALNIRQAISTAKKAVLIGGGYIGLELAASLRKKGLDVTVLEMTERVLQRVTAPEVSIFFSRVHHEEGVEIVCNKVASEFLGDGAVGKVRCSDGSEFDADLVIVGIGVIPNTELAQSAGLSVDDGIVVNEFAQTEDPDIVAAGDCTNHPNAMLNTRLRLESVPNAMEQAKTAALSVCGKPQAYAAHPWFWSDQYDMKLQIAGWNQDYDQVVLRGDYQHGRSFVAWYLKQGKLIAADCINRPKEFMVAKQLLAKGLAVDAHHVADDSLDPRSLLNS